MFVTTGGRLVYCLPQAQTSAGRGLRSAVLSEELEGAQVDCISPGPLSPTRVSLFIGRDRSKWKSGLETYRWISLGEVYPGIELRLKACGNSVEKIFYLAPGADPNRICLVLRGARDLRVTPSGVLEADTGLGPVRLSPPVAYQEIEGRKVEVQAAYRVNRLGERLAYSFQLGSYDRTRPLVIDPLLQSTFLGGDSVEYANAMAVHPDTGDVYVAGATYSSDFPGISGGADTVREGFYEGFVARLTSNLQTLTQATFLGGSSLDTVYDLAIHPDSGDIYAAGNTTSTDFPSVAGGADTTFTGDSEAFVARLASNLQTLKQSTFLGGSGDDYGYGLAIHPDSGDVYVAGTTYSSDFPGVADGADTTFVGVNEDFLARFDSLAGPAVAAIPALNGWGTALFALLLALVCIYLTRKRSAQATTG